MNRHGTEEVDDEFKNKGGDVNKGGEGIRI